MPPLALVAVLWEVWRVHVRHKEYDGLISAEAYALRRQVWKWIDPAWPSDPGKRWERAKSIAGVKEPYDIAERRMAGSDEGRTARQQG